MLERSEFEESKAPNSVAISEDHDIPSVTIYTKILPSIITSFVTKHSFIQCGTLNIITGLFSKYLIYHKYIIYHK